MFVSKKMCIFSLCGIIMMAPGVLFAENDFEGPVSEEPAPVIVGDVSVASSAYVDEKLAEKQNADDTNVYKVGQNGGWVDASNAVTVDTTYLKKTDNSTTGATEIAIDSTKVTTNGTSGLDTESANLIQEGAVAQAMANNQLKPASGIANGKVLTYTGADANANVSAAYITVPVATGAPSTVTPTGFVEMWVQE